MTAADTCPRCTCAATRSTRRRSSGRSGRPTACDEFANAFGMQVYLVTRHDDVKAVLSDHERFSNARPPGFVGARRTGDRPTRRRPARGPGNLLGLDPPEHQRLRRMLTPEFTIRRIKRLEPRITEIVDRAPRRDGSRRAAGRSGRALRAADPVAGDLRAARRALRRPRRLPGAASARQLDLSLPIPERLELQRQGRAYMHVAGDARPQRIPATTSSACWSASTATS